jgi:hypothetical protein
VFIFGGPRAARAALSLARRAAIGAAGALRWSGRWRGSRSRTSICLAAAVTFSSWCPTEWCRPRAAGSEFARSGSRAAPLSPEQLGAAPPTAANLTGAPINHGARGRHHSARHQLSARGAEQLASAPLPADSSEFPSTAAEVCGPRAGSVLVRRTAVLVRLYMSLTGVSYGPARSSREPGAIKSSLPLRELT